MFSIIMDGYLESICDNGDTLEISIAREQGKERVNELDESFIDWLENDRKRRKSEAKKVIKVDF